LKRKRRKKPKERKIIRQLRDINRKTAEQDRRILENVAAVSACLQWTENKHVGLWMIAVDAGLEFSWAQHILNLDNTLASYDWMGAIHAYTEAIRKSKDLHPATFHVLALEALYNNTYDEMEVFAKSMPSRGGRNEQTTRHHAGHGR
jgi:hypothetical protein